jgi:hypothetical protein
MSGVNIRFLYGDYADSPVHLVEIVETLSSSLKGEFLRRFSTIMHNMLFQMCFKKMKISAYIVLFIAQILIQP